MKTKQEIIDLVASLYPESLSNKLSSQSIINDKLVRSSYGDEPTAMLKEFGLNVLIDTKDRPSGEHSGFRGQMFVDDHNNIYAVVRGTSSAESNILLNNLSTDYSVASTGEFDKEYLKELNDFAKMVREYSDQMASPPQIYVHGHSLGGGAAQHLGLLFSMTAPEQQKVLTIASDPVATEVLSDKALAAYKEIKSKKPNEKIDIDVLTKTIDSNNIHALVRKHLPRDPNDRYDRRQDIMNLDLGKTSKMVNLIPAEKKGKYLKFSPVGVLGRQPGLSIIAIRPEEKESEPSVLSSYLSYLVPESITSKVNNLISSAKIHAFDDLMKATDFIAIEDGKLLHKNIPTQLKENIANKIPLESISRDSTPMSQTLTENRIRIPKNLLKDIRKHLKLEEITESTKSITSSPTPTKEKTATLAKQ